jgi:isopenicillin-N N-acyltransferase-like protein
MSVTLTTSLSMDPATRGRELGQRWAAEITRTWRAYERLFAVHDIAPTTVRDVALRTVDAVAVWSPPQAEEIAAIADGAGLELWQAGALNSRSEILTRSRLGVPGECSTFVGLSPDGPPHTIQTWDWQHEMSDVKLVWRYPTPDRTVTTFTEFGVLGKLGVSSAGLGLHFNLLQHTADGDGVGIPVHLVARRVLDEATTVDDAEAIVRSADVTASAALTVVARDGERYTARGLEASPAGTAVLEPDASGSLFHTNHFIDPKLAEGERLGTVDGDTYARLDAVRARADRLRAADFAARIEALVHHREDGAALCCHPEPGDVDGDRWSTHLVVGLEVDRGSLVFQDSGPCTAVGSGYIRF